MDNGSSAEGGDGGMDNGSSGDADSDTDGDADADADTEDETCGELSFPIEANPPRLMLLLDSSSSMNEPISDDPEDWSSPEKWEVAQPVLVQMIADFGGLVHFGFDDGCAQNKGWDWTDSTHTAIRFCDEACDTLQAGQVSNVTATFGCKSVPVV